MTKLDYEPRLPDSTRLARSQAARFAIAAACVNALLFVAGWNSHWALLFPCFIGNGIVSLGLAVVTTVYAVISLRQHGMHDAQSWLWMAVAILSVPLAWCMFLWSIEAVRQV